MVLKKTIVYALFAIIVFSINPVNCMAQELPRDPSLDSLSQRMLEMEKTIDEMNKTILKQKHEDEMEKLLEEAERLSMQEEDQQLDVSKKYFSGVRQQQGLNPNISFGMDFFYGLSSEKANSISEPNPLNNGNNGIYLREAQLSLVAPLDPFSPPRRFSGDSRCLNLAYSAGSIKS